VYERIVESIGNYVGHRNPSASALPRTVESSVHTMLLILPVVVID
jgi:hypothetical protein